MTCYFRFNPCWDSLRGDPRFEEMVAKLAPKAANHTISLHAHAIVRKIDRRPAIREFQLRQTERFFRRWRPTAITRLGGRSARISGARHRHAPLAANATRACRERERRSVRNTSAPSTSVVLA